MRPLTLRQFRRIGEMVSKELPVKAEVEWEYKVGKKSDSINFRIKK